MDIADILVQILSGVTKGALLFLIASGLNITFGVLRVINVAHGSFYMLATFFCYTVSRIVGGISGDFYWWAFAFVPVAVALIGGVVEMTIVRRMYSREEAYQLILFYAIAIILSDVVKMIWGPAFRSISTPAILYGSVMVMDRPFPRYSLFVITIGLLVAIGLVLLLYKTAFGRITRAVVSDTEMVNVLGTNVHSVYTLTFMFGIWLAGLGGVLSAPMGCIGLGVDMDVLVESFAVVVIAGLGSVAGLAVASLMVGLVHSFGVILLPRLAITFIFMIMCAVLITRPCGLFGEPEREA